MAEDRSNNNSKRLVAIAVAAIIGLIGVSVFLEPTDMVVRDSQTVDDSKQQPGETGSDQKSDKAETSSDDKQTYTYTVEAGDSYTLLARQAVAAVGADLSAAQRIAAETKMTQEAGSPYLEVGQVVELDEADVQAAVDWAATLSGADEAAWQPYVDLVILPEIK